MIDGRLSRRAVLAAMALPSSARFARSAQDRLADLERRRGGRLGVAMLDTGARTGPVAWRGGERFAMCSTAKLLSASFVLARVDRGQDSLARRIAYSRAVLLPFSPATQPHADGDGMTLGALCEAALTLSDNTAANLLLESFGGPAALTGFLRMLGDRVTRLDRPEPALNEALPGDPRDTTTPLAMLNLLYAIVLGGALSAPSRAQLAGWLVACRTGDHRLRAGIPSGWRVGDKTGTGEHATMADVAVIWPGDRPPILAAAYHTQAPGTAMEREAVLAEVGRIVAGS